MELDTWSWIFLLKSFTPLALERPTKERSCLYQEFDFSQRIPKYHLRWSVINFQFEPVSAWLKIKLKGKPLKLLEQMLLRNSLPTGNCMWLSQELPVQRVWKYSSHQMQSIRTTWSMWCTMKSLKINYCDKYLKEINLSFLKQECVCMHFIYINMPRSLLFMMLV